MWGRIGNEYGVLSTYPEDTSSASTAAAISGQGYKEVPHLCHHFLTGRVRAIVRDVEWSANEIMRYLLTDYRGKGPADEAPPKS